MGNLMGFDDWLSAQNGVLGAALLEPELVPRVVTELRAEDFTGNGLLVYQAMAGLFRKSRSNRDVDPVAVVDYMGNTPEAKKLVTHLMSCAAPFGSLDRYISMAKDNAKVSRLRDLGNKLSSAVGAEDAVATADAIAAELIERQETNGFEPSALMDRFYACHQHPRERLSWKLRAIGNYVHARKGKFWILGAEPSGGKTAFALEQMWEFSLTKRVLFVSLETDEETIADRMISSIAGIPMNDLADGLLTQQQWERVNSVRDLMAKRTFKIFPAAHLPVSGIKAAAIGYRADIVIIDYLQIIQPSGRGRSRFEDITELSMSLHSLAQSTGMIIFALSQVTNRDPQVRGKPLGMHSLRESGQIECDADVIMMLDTFVEKGLTESGCKANRILRIVKNKDGARANIALIMDGLYQTFSQAHIPNPDWTSVQKQKASIQKTKKPKADSQAAQGQEQMAMLPDDYPVPF